MDALGGKVIDGRRMKLKIEWDLGIAIFMKKEGGSWKEGDSAGS